MKLEVGNWKLENGNWKLEKWKLERITLNSVSNSNFHLLVSIFQFPVSIF